MSFILKETEGTWNYSRSSAIPSLLSGMGVPERIWSATLDEAIVRHEMAKPHMTQKKMLTRESGLVFNIFFVSFLVGIYLLVDSTDNESLQYVGAGFFIVGLSFMIIFPICFFRIRMRKCQKDCGPFIRDWAIFAKTQESIYLSYGIQVKMVKSLTLPVRLIVGALKFSPSPRSSPRSAIYNRVPPHLQENNCRPRYPQGNLS